MPELPEVETMRRGLRCVEGRLIQRIAREPCRLRPIRIEPAPRTFQRLTAGKPIEAVERIGKRVLLRLPDSAIILEPRMTGLVLVGDPPDRDHLRFRIELVSSQTGPTAIWYWDRRGLGSVRLLTNSQIERELGPRRVGPDALLISADELSARLGSSRRQIKPALLDQRILAGVGNLYASELLHLAGIDPRASCQLLQRRHWQRLHQALHNVLQEAIHYEGSTLSDGAYRNALNQDGSYQNHHRVYDRQNQPCPTCARGLIQRIVQTQRATFFCPSCQREPQRRRRSRS